jgi:competence protein ComEC
MKKLKILSKYNKLILLSIILLSLIFTKAYKHNIKIDINQKEIYGYVRKIEDNKIEIKSTEKIIVYIDNPEVELNDYVLVKGDLYYPKNNTIFNLFNYKEYLNNKGIYLLMNSHNLRVIKHNKNILYTVKNSLYKKINDYKSKPYLKIFILGDKSSLDNKEVFKNLGIIHLFSLSGLHIGLIVFILKKLKCKNIFIYLVLLLFLFLTDFHISTVRASLSFIFLNINNKYKLNISSKDRLILLASILLLFNPYYIYDLGYIFSFLITYSIIYFNYLYKDDNYTMRIIKMSCISFITSIPLLINSNFSINFLSVIYNIILIPIVSFVIFPLSIITLILPIDNILNVITTLFEKLCMVLDSIKILTFSFGKLPIWVIIIYYLILFSKIKYKILINILLTIMFYFAGIYVINPRVYFIDVGQGDSTLIRYKNKNILMDTGGSYYKDLSKNSILFFKSIGVKKIDYLILTHGDYDHMGEAKNIINNFNVDKVIFNCGEINELEQEIIDMNVSYDLCVNKIENLHFLQTKIYSDENDNSNVIYTEMDGYKFMFMGDAGAEKEKDILEKYNISNIDVLKIGHHGSKTSSSKNFINEINPKYSIISVGKNNRYGHPNKEVLNILENSKIYRTDQDGSIMFKIKNSKLKIETCAP